MRRKGSVTVFLALSLTCVFSALFAVLEASRVCGLGANSRLCTCQAQDAVLASYDKDLWNNYHLMFWKLPDASGVDPSSMEQLQRNVIEGNWETGGLFRKNYYVMQVHLKQTEIASYELATDDGGSPFYHQAVNVMEKTAGTELLQSMMNLVTQAGRSPDDKRKIESRLWQEEMDGEGLTGMEQKVLDALSDVKRADIDGISGSSGGAVANQLESMKIPETLPAAEGEVTTLPGTDLAPIVVKENPLTWMKQVAKNGVLGLVMPDTEVSDKAIELNQTLGRRSLDKGTMNVKYENSAKDKLLFRLYLDRYYIDATEKVENHALDYELEYLLVGKASDRENLKATVHRLLLLRELTNMAYLEHDSVKLQEATAVAATLSSLVGNPELIPLVQQGVLAAWAYAESISDVKILLHGGKVSLVKTAEQWHTDIRHLSESLSAVNASQSKGLSYANYLQILLWLSEDGKLSFRAMDLVEKNLHLSMNHMLNSADCIYHYEAKPLFWDYVFLGNSSMGNYQFQDHSTLSFLYRKEDG